MAPTATGTSVLDTLERRIGLPARRWFRHGRILPDLPLLPAWAAIGGRRPVLMTGHGRCFDSRRWTIHWRGQNLDDGRRCNLTGPVLAGRMYWAIVMTFPVAKYETDRPTT